LNKDKTASKPQIIYEDKNFLAIDKPAGLLVHPAKSKIKNQKSKIFEKSGSESVLTDWLLKRYPEIKKVGDDPENRPGIVHRLDRETSGVMIVAKNQEYFEYLKSLFKNRQIKKTYVALLWGDVKPETGVVDKPIGIKDGTVRRSVHSAKMKKEAVTKYRVMRYFELKTAAFGEPRVGRENLKLKTYGVGVFSLVEVEPLTGRTHQIRVHMASIGHPVLGDKIYGPRKASYSTGRLMLHALSLEFVSTDGQMIKLEAGLPDDFNESMNRLELPGV